MRLPPLDSVRERGGGDRLTSANIGAGGGVFAGADLLQDFMASRIGQGLRDQVNLMLGRVFWVSPCLAPGGWAHTIPCTLYEVRITIQTWGGVSSSMYAIHQLTFLLPQRLSILFKLVQFFDGQCLP